MQELINVLTRTKTGLYDLVIVSGGETLLSVGSVTRAQAGEWYRICPTELIKDPMTAMAVERIKKGEIKVEVME